MVDLCSTTEDELAHKLLNALSNGQQQWNDGLLNALLQYAIMHNQQTLPAEDVNRVFHEVLQSNN